MKAAALITASIALFATGTLAVPEAQRRINGVCTT